MSEVADLARLRPGFCLPRYTHLSGEGPSTLNLAPGTAAAALVRRSDVHPQNVAPLPYHVAQGVAHPRLPANVYATGWGVRGMVVPSIR
jgi:hypothetical protein